MIHLPGGYGNPQSICINKITSKYIKLKLTKVEVDEFTVQVGDHNTPLLVASYVI